MAYYQSDAPNNEKLNAALAKAAEKLQVCAEAMHQQAARVQTMSQCDHEWQHRVDESFDGHRTDRSDEYTCAKCGYRTDDHALLHSRTA